MAPSSSPATSARSTASRLQDNSAFQFAARTGFAVSGLLHVLIGGIAIGVAFGSGGDADQGGALRGLASTPGGGILLWVVAIGLFALGLFQVLETFLVRGTDKDAWIDRAKEGGKALAYLAIGFSAASVAMGGGGGSSGETQSMTARLLSAPGGVFLVVLLGLGVLAVGVYFIVKGAKKKFLHDISTPAGKTGDTITTLGRVGYIAKGVAISVVGILFGVAAITSDPSEATGLDGALKTLVNLPFGPAILTVVALGLIAYGVYCFARAKYARL
ncbi:DUF1206 domain-containing protein [Salinibacterium sp. SYSU T00001]|uniref:DUF1206 domain-containing protein n=1 Tax=Homoserinimonas sedimenticola TaxID=2986805 RepID=UPI0022365A60|nr:DUF1206 domain-containing protein [Salinibacterium sedimenticola]MCW4385383.1 DUF1206 domain-containing protein [Salinibacterium sedimenticola]